MSRIRRLLQTVSRVSEDERNPVQAELCQTRQLREHPVSAASQNYRYQAWNAA